MTKAKDRKISLPWSLGPFVVSGEPEDGKAVWYSVEFWGIKYSVSGNNRPHISCAASVGKQKNWLRTVPGWLPGYFARRQVWEFTDKYTVLRGGCGDYQSDLASAALKHGVVLDKLFFAEVCREAETAISNLQSEISDAYNPRLRLAKVA